MNMTELNELPVDEFVALLGDVFEQTPAIARQAWQHRPFPDIEALHQTMVAVVNALNPEEQLALIRAHPDLGARVKMTAASVQEQAGAGLDRLPPEEFQQFQELNQAYQNKFGFPFIVAVKHHTKATILEAFGQRLQNSAAAEKQRALQEIGAIAWFRLHAKI